MESLMTVRRVDMVEAKDLLLIHVQNGVRPGFIVHKEHLYRYLDHLDLIRMPRPGPVRCVLDLTPPRFAIMHP